MVDDDNDDNNKEGRWSICCSDFPDYGFGKHNKLKISITSFTFLLE